MLSETDQDQWYVLGAGAMGRLWAATLCEAGNEVVLIRRAVSESTETSANLGSGEQHKNARTTLAYQPSPEKTSTPGLYDVSCCSLDKLNDGSVRNLIVATKSYDVLAAVEGAINKLCGNAFVICLSNGLGYQQDLLDLLTNRGNTIQLHWAICSDGAVPRLLSSSSELIYDLGVTRTGQGTVVLGQLDDSKPIESCHASNSLIDLLNRGGLSASQAESISAALWKKFFINCAINGLTTIFRCKNGELLTDQRYHEKFERLSHELNTLYELLDIEELTPKIKSGSAQKNGAIKQSKPGQNKGDGGRSRSVYEEATEVARATASNRSSMLQDFEASRRNELEFLNHYCVKLLEAFSLVASENRALVERIDALYSKQGEP